MTDKHNIDRKSSTEKLPIIIERKIGGTTYVVFGKYKENGEGLLDKVWRLIEKDNDGKDFHI